MYVKGGRDFAYLLAEKGETSCGCGGQKPGLLAILGIVSANGRSSIAVRSCAEWPAPLACNYSPFEE
jgi:hypothetical protein